MSWKIPFLFLTSLGLFLFQAAMGAAAPKSPKKYLLFVGGGGEPPGDSTRFDEEASIAGLSFRVSQDWSSFVLFDGSRAKSTKAIKDGFGFQAKPFTSANFEAELRKIRSLVRSGKIGRGDEFLLIVDTHGGGKKKNELSHSVSTDDGGVSLDDLRSTQALLEKAGVLLGIIDLSCHSGATQKLATKHTCVISSTSADLPSYSPPEPILINLMQGESLEQVFLESRQNTPYPELPGISTPAGEKTANLLHSLESRLFSGSGSDRFFIEDEMNSSACALEYNDSSLTRLLDDLEKISQSTLDWNAPMGLYSDHWGDLIHPYQKSFRDLTKAIEAYNSLMRMAIPIHRALDKFGDKKETFSIDGGSWILSESEILKIKIENLKKEWSKIGDAYKRGCYLDLLTLVEKRQKELQTDPIISQRIHHYYRLLDQLWGLASEVARQERAFYHVLYQKYSDPSQENPCKDFIL